MTPDFQLKTDHPIVMGILNITPDSFSDGGSLFSENKPAMDKILVTAERMLKAGAEILDVGGESTRPGAIQPTIQQELGRVGPVVEKLYVTFGCPISVDTSRVQIMREVVRLGAAMINDVRALSEPETMRFVAESGVSVCLMHMQGRPDSMQINPQYADPVSEVRNYLRDRVDRCLDSGILPNRICIDPGFGFGKLLEHNLQLIAHLSEFSDMGYPLLVGVSRKGMIGQLTGKTSDGRLAGSLAMAQIALEGGANILRVHDVQETCDMIRVWNAVKRQKEI